MSAQKNKKKKKKKNGAVSETREEDKNRSITTKNIKSVPSRISMFFFFVMTWITSLKEKKTKKQNHPNFIVQEEGILILKKFCEKCFISVTHPMFYMRSVDLNFSSTASGEASE
jgi:hypothetical protein